MENVFEFRNELIDRYSSFSRSFVRISADDIRAEVESQYRMGRYWPEPLIQINPNYRRKGTVQDLAAAGELHSDCANVFLTGKPEGNPQHLHLYAHQVEALAKGRQLRSYVVTTGTGSGKSLSFFIPIVDRIIRAKSDDPAARTRAIVIYPMNALANSQLEELDKFLHGYAPGARPFTVARYTGQEGKEERDRIAKEPPDILLTNFMMLEYILTRYDEVDRQVVDHCEGLEFLVLDELHTYRGRQGSDVAMLVRRLRERLNAERLVCIGTSATMSSSGSQADRSKTVAAVASKLFGTEVTEHDVIGETLERVTDPLKNVDAIRPLLPSAIANPQLQWPDFASFQQDPLAIWVELRLGIELPPDEPPRRARPMSLSEASELLAKDASVVTEVARDALTRFLVAAHTVRTPQGRAPFAFKLHQFISGPGKVLTTLEPIGTRHVTLDAQRFAPGRHAEGVFLYPSHFCRDCGQEYMPVWQADQGGSFSPREIDDFSADDADAAKFGFLCPMRSGQQYEGRLEDLPESWLDLTKAEPKLRQNYKNAIPLERRVDVQGRVGAGEAYWFIPGKFRFCLNCGTVHEAHGKDANRLSSLSGEGRSSATTMIALSALQQLFAMPEPAVGLPDPRKLLGFTDNRQDAALQAGHFNDFVYLLTLRAGLVGALQNNDGVLDEEGLADEVFKALGFERVDQATLLEYLKTPKLMGLARKEAQRALRFIIAYRLIRDLRRGWRFNNPNLDQLGLLDIGYRELSEFCSNTEVFKGQKMLAKLSVETRERLYSLIFDTLRRQLCIETRYLDAAEQDKNKATAFAHLNERWAFQHDEMLETGRFLIFGKRPEYKGKPRTDVVTGGPKSRLLRQVKTADFWATTPVADEVVQWKETEWAALIESALESAVNYGYIAKAPIDDTTTGWRLKLSAVEWRLLKAPPAGEDSRVNAFFRTLYLSVAELLRLPTHPLFEFEAHEHTAQVDAGRRQLLEQRFRFTEKDRKDWAENPAHDAPLQRLPVMFCSPTMELGVDISALNTVYLRNMPPTPANYAQRSGRAGRSGQQALVITYCAAQSPHDQWFFNHARDMVHGIVRAPTLDLSNRDLIESHLHAIWLASTQLRLETSIAPMLDLEQPGKPLNPELWAGFTANAARKRALASARRVIARVETELAGSHWYTPDFVDAVVDQAAASFSDALDRWRALYDATAQQMKMADAIVSSHAASQTERQNAQRRYADAARQFALLLKTGNSQNNDFYTYRYLASQGFLPGYNFPRLPLMAWIPARGGSGANMKEDDGSMVSRPRFLALSEFGPRSLIYHQGRMYRVVRAKLGAGNVDHVSSGGTLATIASLVCGHCGYGHLGEPGGVAPAVSCCENCDALLTDKDWVTDLYRIETVETVAVERISINDEERQRLGFELQTTYRFLPGPDGLIARQKAEVRLGPDPVAALTYAPAARIWRINRGWRRRKDKEQLGFYINPITGTWSKQDDPTAGEQGGDDAPMLEKVPNQRIVPFVEDHRNLLILAPVQPLPQTAMATLQAALKRGVELCFQIEESELVAEPLPTADERRALLFYEAAEGGAGVLTRLANDSISFAQVARQALRLLHFREPPDGIWTLEGLPALEETNALGNPICEAGCYQCLLSYFNQPDHEHINRRDPDALKLLVALANSEVVLQTAATPLDGDAVGGQADDALAEWLSALTAIAGRKPDALQIPVMNGAAVAAAQYKAARALVFLTVLDARISAGLVEKGWTLLDFSEPHRWHEKFTEYASVFASAQPVS